MMDIHFQGMNPVFSSTMLGLLVLLILVLSWWSYSHLDKLPAFSRWSLIALRSSALLILVLLLFNPFIQVEEIERQNPKIAVYFDESQSMSIERGDYFGWDSYRSVIESLQIDGLTGVDVTYYGFDSDVRELEEYPILELSGGITNIDDVIRHILDRSGELAAAVIVSDGILTRGRNPVFHARELNIPLFTIPVGDTSASRDIAISEIATHETGYIHTRQPAEVTIIQDGFEGESTRLELRRDGETVETEELLFGPDESVHRVRFELEFTEPGLHHYEAYISELEGELTTENNTYPFSVNVIEERTTIYHLAFEIHPDVRIVRTILASDQNIDLHTFTWIGNRFLEGSPDSEPESIDLLILHGPVPDEINLPAGLTGTLPSIQFLTSGMTSAHLTQTVIPLHAGNRESVQIEPLWPESNRNHPVLQFELEDLSRQSGLFTPFGSLEVPATASVLMETRAEGNPVLIVEETGNIRRAVVNAHGWYRLAQSEEDRIRELNTHLISNLTAWAATSPDAENLRIRPGKDVYQEGEQVWFRADLLGETGVPVTDAVIEVVITGPDDEGQSYTMQHQNRGHYQLPVPTRSPGTYSYHAEARQSGQVLDSANGEYSITASTLEFTDTRRNDTLLRQLSDITGGAFLDTSQQDPTGFLQEELQQRELLEQIEERSSVYRFLHQHFGWFIVIMILLTSEWVLRRRHSLP